MDESASFDTVAAMSYVVRHKQTGDYLRGSEEWTRELSHAVHFETALRLVQYLESLGAARSPESFEIVPVSAEDRPLLL